MSYAIAGIPCEIKLDSDGASDGVGESWPEDGPKATVNYHCPWGSRFVVMNALRGGPIGEGAALVAPHQYPDSPNLYCLSIGELQKIKAMTALDGWPTYRSCVIPAEYGVPPYDFEASVPGTPWRDPSGRPYTVTEIKTGAEMLIPPNGSYFWEDGPDVHKPVVDAHVGLLRAKIEINMTFHQLHNPSLDYLVNAVGTVNKNTIKIGDYTFLKGELLLATADSKQSRSSPLGRAFEVRLVLLAQGPVANPTEIDPDNIEPVEWNKFLCKDGTWQYLNTKADGFGHRPYPYKPYDDDWPYAHA